MKPFKYKEYYKYALVNSDSDDEGIVPTPEGLELLVEYYKKKYQTNIVLPVKKKLENTSSETSVYSSFEVFVQDIKKYLAELRKHVGEFRQAYLIGVTNVHAIPIIYIKDNEEEVFLIADSMGLINKYTNQHTLKELKERLDIPLYVVKDQRQADYISCFADALVLGRDSTAKNEGKYRIENLLNKIKERATIDEAGFYEVLLPDELLKTAQLEKFVSAHEVGSDAPIYRKESLKLFRERYITDEGRAGYLLEKGLKYSELIEILYYVNELKHELKEKWDDVIEKKFIINAKKMIKDLGIDKANLQVFSEEFASSLRKRKQDVLSEGEEESGKKMIRK